MCRSISGWTCMTTGTGRNTFVSAATIIGCLLLVLPGVCAAIAQTSDNPCSNGSFEVLEDDGFPQDWQPVGDRIEVSRDAHSGDRAVRLLRTPESAAPETGLNRDFQPDSGGGGAMIDRRTGGIEFWYKAIAAEEAELLVFAIPMNAEPKEGTGSPRAGFRIPDQHVGDGRWHRGRLRYDFEDDSRVRWIQFAARIVGTAGELLLDDMAYLETTGPLLDVGTIRVEEAPADPGRSCTLRAAIENRGDAVADTVQARLELPDGLSADSPSIQLGPLNPGQRVMATWTVAGPRRGEQTLRVVATGAGEEDDTTYVLQPGLVLRSFGPVAPVASVDLPIALECELRNEGTASVLAPETVFRFGNQTSKATMDEILPGQSIVLRARFTLAEQTTDLPLSVRVTAQNVPDEMTADSHLVVGAAVDVPADTRRLVATVADEYALLGNRDIQLVFPKNEFGFGTAELAVRQGSRWHVAARLPRLSKLIARDADGQRFERTIFATSPPTVESANKGRLIFHWTEQDGGGCTWKVRVSFELGPFDTEITVQHELSCDQSRELLLFEGPMLCATSRDEAIFPGLEWLVDDEVSSSSLDIAADHPHRIRYVVHPNMVTVPAIGIHSQYGTIGLLWDVHQRWDGDRDRPSVMFASPDRFQNQRTHLAGLFLPSVPEFVDTNQTEAARPYPLTPDKTLRIESILLANPTGKSAVDAVERWVKLFGFPQPAPLPLDGYEHEIEFSMQAYWKSLWLPEAKEWWTTKGNAVLSTTGRPRTFIADLLVGSLLCPDAASRRRCLARAEEMMALVGGKRRLDAQRFPNRADLAYANPSAASRLLGTRGDDGAWRFDADQQHESGPFAGRDYYELGSDNAVESGTCARNAYEVLRYARIAGDWEAYQQMRNTLALIESFQVPRAAQVWEVPVHTPDLLAAADAMDANIEAYRMSGDPRWLNDAVVWAKRGLPFIYLWQDPERPYLAGASIPVFGATWHQGSWFGRPVQWNGLRYADALLKLAEYNQEYAWRQLAETIVRSAIHQQERNGENAALWPDSISAIDGEKSAWIFAPHQILQLVLKLIGRTPEPMTLQAGVGERRIHVSAAASLRSAVHRGAVLSVELQYPDGEQGVVLVSNITRPETVRLDGNPIRERIEIERGVEPGWRYDAGNAYLAIRVPKDGASTVRVEGGFYRDVRRLPWPMQKIDFAFDDSLDGWLPAHHIAEMSPDNGVLTALISGPDPYLVRNLLSVDGSQVPTLRLRMRLTVGTTGQLFWSTEQSPGFDEPRTLAFVLIPDGQFHEYRLEVGRLPAWSGETITGLRLDPCGGTRSGEFSIDYLRGDIRQ